MGRHIDPDLLVIEAMLAPPPLEDARRSLEYWERRRESLPLHRRGARREAREMAARWSDRVQAAERAQFEATLLGRALKAVGASMLVNAWAWPTKGRVSAFAWVLVPRQIKLVAAGVIAAWLAVLLGTLLVSAALVDRL
jgi:hypothetical protein